MSDNAPFLGLPVSGYINQNTRGRREQRPVEEFGPLLSAVLNDPMIHSVGWAQYTPYFNDGDPCEFGVRPIWVLTVNDVMNSDEDEDEDYYDYWDRQDKYGVDYGEHPTLGWIEKTNYQGEWPNRTWDTLYHSDFPETLIRVEELGRAVEGGEFEDVLRNAFGDHASITVTRDGITVEVHEHD